MWKYIKGTEKDFDGLDVMCNIIVETEDEQRLLYAELAKNGKYDGLYVYVGNIWVKSSHTGLMSIEVTEGDIIAYREWIEESYVETKPEEHQPLPTKDRINIADAMEQSSTPRIGSMMNPAKDLPKIKLDVKKPIFDKGDDKEVKFIYSNNIYSVFELTDGDIFCIEISKVDTYFYNKPDVKTTEQLISDAWNYARNDGSLWASPTQLFYMAIEQLVKDGVVDMNKVYEVKQ